MRRLLIGAASAALLSCGGGGSSGGGTSPTTPANRPPIISAGSGFSLLENTTEVGIVTASDPEGKTLTYSIIGGADAALFVIDSGTGALTMIEAPNYDRPVDADLDNVYEVTVQVSDGSLSASTTLNVMVENDKEGVDVRRLTNAASGSVALTATYYNVLNMWRINTVTNNGRFRTFGSDGALLNDVMLAGTATTDVEYLGLGIVRPDTKNVLLTLLRVGSRIELWARPMDRLTDMSAPFMIWSRDYSPYSVAPFASLICKEFCTFATGWNGNDADAQSANDGYGEKIAIDFDSFGAYDNAGSWTFTTQAYGLREPVVVWPGTSVNRDFVVDRGERYTEVNRGGLFQCGAASVRYCPSNFGWPYYDGPDEGPSMPTAPIENVLPAFYRPQGSGLYQLEDATGLVLAPNVGGLGGTVILSDRKGEFYMIPWDVVRTRIADDQSFERRTEDFRPDVGTINEILSMFDANEMFGSGIPPAVYILDSDGEIYVLP